ncbi:UNKNOWN [Stylonychia lemnae]|uniref:UDENN domain-containing protein n=1 Tax=Stylonychia lemnae TaxID=5949 RepID=A0A078A9X7_STYLE|nr:UNKNOWN [Stylonychia lemnae]|eukprot:CDW77603.1 UNKNOWN [Stylonychia lemnae]
MTAFIEDPMKTNITSEFKQIISFLTASRQKLENERDMKAQLQSEMNMIKERMQYLEQRNTYLEGEIKQQNSASKRITFCAGISHIQEASSIGQMFSPDDNKKEDRSMSPTRNLFNTNLNTLILDQKSPQQIPVYEAKNMYVAPPNNVHQLIHVNQKNLSISNHSNSIEEDDDSKQNIQIQILKQPLSNLRFSNENFKHMSTIDTKRTQVSIDTRDQFRIDMSDNISTGQNTHRSRQNTTNLKRGQSNQYSGLSIDYRDNDPQQYNVLDQPQEKRERRNNALRKFKSGDQQFFEVFNNTDTMASQQNIEPMRQDYNQMAQEENDYYNNQVQDENIVRILRGNRQYNLGFSRLQIRTIDEHIGMQAIKLKYDPIRVAQQSYRQQQKSLSNKRKQERETAKSMQFNENVKAGQLHQLQPSQMLRKETQDKRHHQYFNKLSMNDFDQFVDGDVIIEDEDSKDCQDGGNTPFQNYDETVRRPQVMFQNHEIMMYHSPKQHRGQSKEEHSMPSCFEEDDYIQQTTRIMEDQTFTQQHMLLETPSNKPNQLKVGQHSNEIYRAAQYSNEHKMQMERSIVNYSHVKSKRSKQKVTDTTSQFKKKQMIEESDDEQDGSGTPYESKDKSTSFAHNQLIKNPCYDRVTLASKNQIDLKNQLRMGGQTIGPRNDRIHGAYQGQKSLASIDDTRRLFQNANTDPFSDVSGMSGLQSSGFYEQSTIQDVVARSIDSFDRFKKQTQIKNFNSPHQNIRSTNNLLKQNSRFESPGNGKVANVERLFEEFFIIGVEYNDIKTLDWNKSPTQFIAPQTLYMYSDQSKEECDRRRVVKDFCFPDGVEVKRIKDKGQNLNEENKAQFSKILYQTKNLRESCFIFTMNASEDMQSDTSLTKSRNQSNEYQETFPDGVTSEKFYSCLCVVFNELISDQSQQQPSFNETTIEKKFIESKIFSAKKAYCFMFANHYYQLHLETINLLINVLKDNYIDLSNRILSNDLLRNLKNQTEKIIKLQLLRDIFSNLQQKLIIDEMYTILNKCYLLDLELVNEQIILDFSSSIGQLKYDLPNITEIPYLEHNWFCPQLFQLFSIDIFLRLLQAIMLERSVIFVGKANLISTAILGFNCLLYPFRWCFAFVPILPHPLIDMIEAPVPLLVGITKKEYKDLKLTEEERSQKIWVNLEDGSVQWNSDEVDFPTFDFEGLQGKISKDYQNFIRIRQKPTDNKNSGTDRQQFTQPSDTSDYLNDYDSARSSFVSDFALVFNDKQKEKCKNICMQIRYSIKRFVLGCLKDIRKNKLSTKFDNLVQQIGDMVVSCSKDQDRKFIEQFVQTQMFTTYIEDIM